MVVSELGLHEIFLLEDHFNAYLKQHPELVQDEEICLNVKRQLDEYFKGQRKHFELTLAYEATPFRKLVWENLRKIPYGKTISYSDLAAQIGNPKAVRAVGGANRANPIPIIVPCHRVIGKSGKLVGYMGDKTHIQEKLILHEQAYKDK